MLENHVATRRACAHRRVAGTVLAAVLWTGACQDPVRPATTPPTHGPARTLVAAATVALQPWELENPATNHEIEGYASATSVNVGESIQLFVNTSSPTYAVSVYRMGWYNGAGALLVYGPVTRTGTVQPAPVLDATTGLVECRWTNPLTLTTSATTWKSGVYLAKLTASSGKSSYVIFVVREDARTSTYLMQLSFNTYQAYNFWGGGSLYGDSIGGQAARAVKVSFNRPYAKGTLAGAAKGVGAGEFLTTLAYAPPNAAAWEYNMIRFLERENLDVTYTTDYDVGIRPQSLLNHRALLIAGHDEYWTMGQRNAIVAARDAGVHLGFFSANTGYWQVRFEPSLTGIPDRTMVGYKEITDPVSDPMLRTTLFRNLGLPENQILGVMYQGMYGVSGYFVISDASTWVTEGTGATNGTLLPGLEGSELDVMTDTVNASQRRIGHSCFNSGTPFECGDATYYVAGSGATVFAAGTFQWSWGLDDYNAPDLHPSYVSSIAQGMMRNILRRFSTAPPPAAVAAVKVTLTPSSVPAGSTSQATATLRDSNGNLLTGRTVTWSLGATNDAKVSATGLVTTVGSKPSSVIVTATSEGQSGSATLTITSRK